MTFLDDGGGWVLLRWPDGSSRINTGRMCKTRLYRGDSGTYYLDVYFPQDNPFRTEMEFSAEEPARRALRLVNDVFEALNVVRRVR